MRIGNREIEISNADKVFFGEGLTKGDLLDYYREVSETMHPYLEGHPLVMHRFPDGIEGEGFYQKETPDHFPDWIARVEVKKEGGTVTHVVGGDAATLVYLANQAVVTPHVWLSRVADLDHPDQIIFDLDPQGEDFDVVRRGALTIRDLMDDLGLVPYVKTSGSKGLHVHVPLDASADFDEARAFARDVAELVARRDPDRFTTEQRKKKRKGRLLIDYLRNAYGQTAVAPFAVRAREGAPVATPVAWDEVSSSELHPRRYTIENIFRRLAQKEDPWKGMGRHSRSLDGPRGRLEDLLGETA